MHSGFWTIFLLSCYFRMHRSIYNCIIGSVWLAFVYGVCSLNYLFRVVFLYLFFQFLLYTHSWSQIIYGGSWNILWCAILFIFLTSNISQLPSPSRMFTFHGIMSKCNNVSHICFWKRDCNFLFFSTAYGQYFTKWWACKLLNYLNW